MGLCIEGGGKEVRDIDILPIELRKKSISDREISLKYEDLSEAIKVLSENNWGIIAWEVWFLYPNKAISHMVEVDGATYIDSGNDYYQADGESWVEFIKRTETLCIDEAHRSTIYWRERCSKLGIEPYICIQIEQ